jgi:glycine betaine/proline transport system substrate-binding protein
MILRKMNKIFSLFLLITVVVVLSACQSRGEEITFSEGDWDSNAFHNQVAKFIIENGYGVDVNIVLADTSIMVSALKAQNIDAALEIWSDNIPSYNNDLENNEYEQVSINFADNEQGLYIPAYLQEAYPGLVSVTDLLDYAHLFPDPEGSDKSIIYGGPEGWAATIFLHDKMSFYGLDELYNFKTIDSGATLSATLASAYAQEKPWVGYNWEPTWIMGLYEMVLLEDSEYNPEDFAMGKGAFPSVDVTVVVRNEFQADYPEIYEFLSNYKTTSALTSEALAYMQENSVEADVAAIWFLNNYKELWSQWLPEDIYNKVIDALEA